MKDKSRTQTAHSNGVGKWLKLEGAHSHTHRVQARRGKHHIAEEQRAGVRCRWDCSRQNHTTRRDTRLTRVDQFDRITGQQFTSVEL